MTTAFTPILTTVRLRCEPPAEVLGRGRSQGTDKPQRFVMAAVEVSFDVRGEASVVGYGAKLLASGARQDAAGFFPNHDEFAVTSAIRAARRYLEGDGP